jgi:hypothetical protein
MSQFTQFVALVAVFGVLVVLITPVQDELPCAPLHVAFIFVLPLVGISTPVQPVSPSLRSNVVEVPLFSGTDLLYFTCTLLF